MWGWRKGVDLTKTPEIRAFFARLDLLDDGQLMGLRAAWNGIDRQRHEEAWAAVRAVGASQGLARQISRVRDRALDWSSRGRTRPSYDPTSVSLTREQAKLDAAAPIVDAAIATALGDRLEPRARETLIGPWLRVTEKAG